MKSLYHMAIRFLAGLYKGLLLFLSLSLMFYIFQNSSPAQYEKTIEQSPGQFMDCRVFRSFGALAASKQRAHLYDWAAQKQCFLDQTARSGSTAAQDSRLEASYVPYPPSFAALWMPLSLLSEPSCLLLWNLISVLAFAAGSFFLAKSFDLKLSVWFWVFVGTLASVPAMRCAALGQTSLLFCGFFCLFLSGIKKMNRLLTAASLNLLLLKPPLAVLPVLLLLRKDLTFAILYAAGIFLALTAVLLAILGPEPFVSYPQALINVSAMAPSSFHIDDMANLRGALASLGLANSLPATLAFLAAGIITLLLRKRKGLSLELLFFWLLSATLAFGTHIHIYECCLLSIPALLFLASKNPEFADCSVESFNTLSPQSRTICVLRLFFFFLPLFSWLDFILFYEKSQLFFSTFALINLALAAAAAYLALAPLPRANLSHEAEQDSVGKAAE